MSLFLHYLDITIMGLKTPPSINTGIYLHKRSVAGDDPW